MTAIQPATVALEGDVEQPVASHYTHGADLDYVLEQLDTIDPIDVETEDAPDVDWEIHKALNYVRAQIIKRKAVQAGPRHDVDYCGLSHDSWGRACGPELGLPQCAYHGRPDTLGVTIAQAQTTTAPAIDAVDPKEQ